MQAAEKAKKQVLVGHCLPFLPEYAYARKLIDSVPSIIMKLEDGLDKLANNPPPVLRRFLKRDPEDRDKGAARLKWPASSRIPRNRRAPSARAPRRPAPAAAG